MNYRHLSHCLSRYIPTRVFTEYDLLGLFLSWVPNPQIISVLFPTLVLIALHILKEHQMLDDYPILHCFFQSEDKNVVSISPSQLGRISCVYISLHGLHLNLWLLVLV